MDYLVEIADLFLHIDWHLATITTEYGGWTYAILVLIIFCETGLVITPFLPGDSLLFAAGALAAGSGGLNPTVLLLLLTAAAIVGDSINYAIGSAVGMRVFDGRYRVLKPEYLERTNRFYERYGGKTIVLARFVPIVRTYAPFVAGAASMSYPRFLFFNVTGGGGLGRALRPGRLLLREHPGRAGELRAGRDRHHPDLGGSARLGMAQAPARGTGWAGRCIGGARARGPGTRPPYQLRIMDDHVPAPGRTQPQTQLDGVYTEEQAAQGEEVFRSICSNYHDPSNRCRRRDS